MLKDIFKKDIDKELKKQETTLEQTNQEIETVQTEVDKLASDVSQKEKLFEQQQEQVAKTKLALVERLKTIDETDTRIKELADELINLKTEKARLEREDVDASSQLQSKTIESDKLQYEIKKLKEELFDTKSKIKKNEEQVTLGQEEAEQLSFELKDLRNDLEVQTLKLNTQTLMVSKTDKEVRVAKEEKREKLKEKDSIMRKMEALEVSIRDKEKKIAEVKDEIRMLELDNETKRAKVVEMDEELRSNEIKLVDLEEKSEERKMSIREVDEEIFKIKNEIKIQHDKLEEKTADLAKLTNEVGAKEAFLERQHKVVSINKTKLSEKMAEIGRLEESIRKSEKNLAAVQREVQLQNKLLLSRKEKARDQSNTFNTILATIAEKEDQKKINLVNLKELHQKILDNETSLKDREETLKALREDIQDQEGKIFDSNMEVERLTSKIEEKNEFIEGQRKNIEHNKEVLRAYVAQISENKTRVEDLELKILRNKQVLDKTVEKIKSTDLLNEGLKDTISNLATQNSKLENQYREAERKHQDLVAKKRELLRVEEQENLKIVEYRNLIKDQKAYIEAASEEVMQIEENINNRTSETRELNKVIGEYKDEVSRFDSEIHHNRIRLKNVEKEIVTLVETKTEYEMNLHNRVELIYNQSEMTKALDDEVKDYLASIKNDARKRYALLKGTQEGVNRSAKLVEEKIKAAAVLKKKIREMQDDYAAGQRELARLNGQLKETKKRLGEGEASLYDYQKQSEELFAKQAELDNELMNLVNEEKIIYQAIDVEKRKIAEFTEKVSAGQSKIDERNEKAKELNKQLKILQINFKNNEVAQKKQVSHIETIEDDVKALEKLVENLAAKIDVQNSQMNKQDGYIKQLTDKNKALSFKIAKLDELFDKNRVHLADKTADVEKLEASLASKEQEYDKKKGLAEKFDMVEKSGLPKIMEMMKETLEGKHFGLSMNYDGPSFESTNRYTSSQFKVLEIIQSQFVEAVESGLSLDAEVFTNFKVVDRAIEGSFTVIDVTGVDSTFVKDILTPFAQKITAKYVGSKLSVKIKADINKETMSAKIGMDVRMPVYIPAKKATATA